MNATAINCQSCNASLNLELTRNGICYCEYCGTAHNLSREITLKCDLNSHKFAVLLYKILHNNFSLIELKELVLNFSAVDRIVYLQLNWEDIPGNVKSAKCQELVLWCNRRGVLNDFVEFLVIEKPFIVGELL